MIGPIRTATAWGMLVLPWLAWAALTAAPGRSAPSIRLIYTASLRGVLEPCGCQPLQSGGLSRRATLLRNLVDPRERSILVDVGDNVPPEGARPEMLFFLYRALQRMRYDAVSIGPFDLALPGREIEDAARTAGITLLAQPSTDNAEQLGPAMRLVTAGGARVALLGAAPALDEAGAQETLRQVCALARHARPAADLVVVLSQLDPHAVEECAKSTPEIDVIVSGRHDMDLTGPIRIGSTFILPCAAYGQAIGVAGISLRPQGGVGKLSLSFRSVSANMAKDPRMAALVGDYYKRYSSITPLARGPRMSDTALAGMLKNDGGAALGCRSCHETEYVSWCRTRHAHAWQTLVAKGASSRTDCLSCHTTRQLTLSSFSPDATGVTCTACHGGDPEHARHPSDPRFVVRRPAEAVCRACHSPLTSPRFSYPSFLPLVMHTRAQQSGQPRQARSPQG